MGDDIITSRFEAWSKHQVPCGAIAHILTVISAPPNHRYQPQPGDRRDLEFCQWFDGGAIAIPTGGAFEYHFDDGVLAKQYGFSPNGDFSLEMHVEIRWPDGRVVRIDQQSDPSSPRP